MSISVLSKQFNLLKTDLIEAYDKKGMRASGRFADSLEVQTFETATGYKAILYGENYSQQLETGRNSGKYPPMEMIKKWIMDKGVFTQALQTISISSLAFLIARKIAREGWKRQGYGGVNLISEVVTDERIQMIIDEVGAVEAMRYTTEILGIINELELA